MFPLDFLIELIQAISRRGVFDIGDIILYGVGILIGYIIEKTIMRIQESLRYWYKNRREFL